MNIQELIARLNKCPDKTLNVLTEYPAANGYVELAGIDSFSEFPTVEDGCHGFFILSVDWKKHFENRPGVTP